MSPALAHLSKDPVMKKLIKQFPLEPLADRGNLYNALVRTIIGQQLSTKAADTITKRFNALFTSDTIPAPKDILAIPDDTIRAAGLSYAKIKYVKGLAQAIIDKSIDLDAIPELSDEDVIAELTKLKGIGVWTAEMILMFHLNRPDVFSMGDLGLKTAVGKLYNVDRNDLHAIVSITQQWKPYRTTASRLLWQSLDNTP